MGAGVGPVTTGSLATGGSDGLGDGAGELPGAGATTGAPSLVVGLMGFDGAGSDVLLPGPVTGSGVTCWIGVG